MDQSRNEGWASAAADLKLAYYAYGREDFVARNTDQLKGTLKKYGIMLTLHETSGGHTWINWREYLNDFALRLFK
jgi:enterochelin esterase-like enzyme